MKLKKPTSKVLGELTGKLVAGTKALPGKTSETTSSIKAEFIAGFNSTNTSTKKLGDKSAIIEIDDEFPDHL